MPLLKKLRHLFQPKALVLMYHRIAVVKNDPWQLAVSPENFEQQLQVLKETCKVISVNELAASLQNKSISNNCVCLTFDDGYRDNYLSAKPLLEKYNTPATFFITNQFIGQQIQFWWDELETIFLSQPELPQKLSLFINNALFEYDLLSDHILTDDQLEKHRTWAWPSPAPTRRCELYLSIWEHIRPLQYSSLEKVIENIKLWAAFEGSTIEADLPMTTSQLQELSSHPLIDLGIHTVTHPALSTHPYEVQRDEMLNNKLYLQNICERSIDAIAYPYGNYNNTTLSVAKELNLTAAFTTTEKIVNNQTHPYQIGRFQVRNGNGTDFKRWLFSWKKSARFL